jgi:hypothetical protein
MNAYVLCLLPFLIHGSKGASPARVVDIGTTVPPLDVPVNLECGTYAHMLHEHIHLTSPPSLLCIIYPAPPVFSLLLQATLCLAPYIALSRTAFGAPGSNQGLTNPALTPDVVCLQRFNGYHSSVSILALLDIIQEPVLLHIHVGTP